MNKLNSLAVVLVLKWVLVLALLVLIIGTFYWTDQAGAQISPNVGDKPTVRYIPPDEIYWDYQGSQGDEIIDVEYVNDHTWRFFIYPDPGKLTLSDRTAYPYELYHLDWVTTGTGVETKIKSPITKLGYSVRNIPMDSKTTPVQQLQTNRVDLTANWGVEISTNTIDILKNSTLHIGVHSATYTAVSDTIILTGSPVSSFNQHIYDALYGVAPGTPITKCGSRCFCYHADLDFGDGVTATNASDSACSMHFDHTVAPNDNVVIYLNKAHLTLGEMENSIYKTTERGVFIFDENTSDTDHYLLQSSHADNHVNLYSSKFMRDADANSDRARLLVEGNGRIWNCDFSRVYLQNIGVDSTVDVYNTRVEYNSIAGLLGSSVYALYDRLYFDSLAVAIYANTAITANITNSYFNGINNDIINVNSDAHYSLVNCVLSDDTLNIAWAGLGAIGSGSSSFYEQYTVDLLVTSQSGTPVDNIPITISNVFGTPVFSSVILSGTIPTQTLSRLMYSQTDGGSTTYSPYTITIDETIDYQGYTDIFELDSQKYFEISLLSHVDSGTTAGDVWGWLTDREDEMEIFTGVLFVLVVVALALWIRQWWMLIFSGMCSIGWGGIMYDDGLYYGVPFFVLGMLLLGYMAKLEFSRYSKLRR